MTFINCTVANEGYGNFHVIHQEQKKVDQSNASHCDMTAAGEYFSSFNSLNYVLVDEHAKNK